MFHECRHIKPNGSKCHSPCLKDKPYCYYHTRVHQWARVLRAPAVPYEQKSLEIPFLEDRGAVQIGLSEVVSALAAHRIEFKRAALMIYALQVASSNAKTSTELVAIQQVRDTFETDEGEQLAPETTTYEQHDEGYKDPNAEESMADLLMREIKKQRAREDKYWMIHGPMAPEDEPTDAEIDAIEEKTPTPGP